ncbi:uncharacterized protein LOC141638281 [Silene latifolia]|uniref:uncharacterized protein LOC141638281 n=1 Tax=Silene latifolia TaxID=37657 RepID=UPI003D779EA5
MERSHFPLLCYWDGEIVEGDGCVSYVGGNESFIFANSNMSFNDLHSEIYTTIGLDSSKYKLVLKMKFPSLGCFKVVSLNNDRSLQAMWASICHSKAGSMDIYVELVPIQQPQVSNANVVPNVSFTRMLNDNNLFLNNFMSPTHNVQGLGSDDRYVSLLTNNIGVEVGDGNIQGDEVEDDVDLRLENASDEDDEDEEDIDHVGEFSVGQTFPNKRSLTEAITSYNLRVNQSFKIHESKPHTVTYKCGRRSTSCSWTLRAPKKKLVSDAFTIVRYNGGHERSCVGDTMPIDHRNLRRTFSSNAIRNIVEADWGLTVNAIIEIIIDKYNYKITYIKAWKAKQKALADIFGDWELSYQLLPRFFEALKEANPGTVVQFVNYPTDDPNVVIFGRVFWAFGASIKGFPHCRPIITIDGTHLYGKYKGVLMIAMGVDANDQLYPLAFAIVELKTTETWSWFLACIRCLVTQRSGLCVISDRHPGIMKAMNENGSGWV